ncbi:MAG: 2-C-methyl-D-erythritol 4-phosphate cytidylyltransferase [Gammaproteobacteria bacterium]|nr:2-C-methyl-D-erythritol 4-phosphate cytidylyltransferase [Gammaproteobacteria bacterium]
MSHVESLDGISVVIPAAGLGIRMESKEPKQYIQIAGKTILEHTLLRILGLRPRSVILVISAEDNLFETIPAIDQCQVVCGGAERIDSVLNGMKELHGNADDWVMVHDAVRPCVRASDILSLCSELQGHEVGGLLGIPVTDTVKRVEKGSVLDTQDRSRLWLAQTPQLFRHGILLQALQGAPAGVTDEASAVECLGYQPKMVQGHSDNIKVTTQDDLKVAAFHLSQEGRLQEQLSQEQHSQEQHSQEQHSQEQHSQEQQS